MNEAKLHEFMGKFVTDMGGAYMMEMVLIGDELGLYKAMAGAGPLSSEEVAERAGVAERSVREIDQAGVFNERFRFCRGRRQFLPQP